MSIIGQDIAHAVTLLKKGQLVSIPTETVYGLAGNALDESAVLSIFKAKNRPSFDPLIAHVGSVEAALSFTQDQPGLLLDLMEHFWPGPLTFLLDKKPVVSDLLTSGSKRVAVRMPKHPMTQELLQEVAFPLAAPSANPFGYVSPTTAKHVQDQLGNVVPYILDGGPASVGLESTIIGMENDELVVYRLGGIPVEELERFAPVHIKRNKSSNPVAPGMLKSHYAPGSPVIVGDISEMLTKHASDKIGIISFTKNFGSEYSQIILSESGSLDEAAARLFEALRKMDRLNVDVILTEHFPDKGLGKAINDRLQRASVR